MGFQFTGHVLQGPRISPANAATTGEATTGVIRNPRPVPSTYWSSFLGANPEFVDAAADQYRTAVLRAPGTTPVEYLVWAQNTGSLAYIDDPSWWVEQGSGYIPIGTLTVTDLTPVFPPPNPFPLTYGTFTDGTNRVVVTDDGNRSLGSITWLVVARGDVDDYDDEGWNVPDFPLLGRKGVKPYQTLQIFSANQNPVSGVVLLTAAQLTNLGGGLSRDRGDRIISARYTIAPARFWWTRNDRYETRFGWRGKTQRWEAFKGSNVKNEGILLLDTVYQLSPKLKNFPIGAYLPGDGTQPDKYSMIRLGTLPGATSTPVANDGTFLGVLVVSDADAGVFDFSRAPGASAVMGQTSGVLQFNPDYARLYAGQTIWYSYRGFSENEVGVVGKMYKADRVPLFIAPIPGPTDHPLIKFGNRRYLEVTLVDTDALLESASEPPSGSVIVSLSTGRLRFNTVDIEKADPDQPNLFSKYFFGEDVIYDGVALNFRPQPTKAPVQLLDQNGAPTTVSADGELYIPNGTYLPEDFVSADPYRGLGVSGIIDAPDATGAVPMYSALPASVRPGGDTLGLGAFNTGRVRQVEDGVGDTILFSKRGACTTILPVNLNDDLPEFPFTILFGNAYVAREATTVGLVKGSKVGLGSIDRAMYDGDPIYFLQASLTPAIYVTKARLYSRNRDIFRFTGTEKFYFNFGGAAIPPWTPTNLLSTGASFFTAAEVAADIQTFIGGAGVVYEQNGRIVLEANNVNTGTVEIQWGNATSGRDLSGAAVLGFLPGWKAQGGVDNWLPDSGACLGLYRSPVNLNRFAATPDVADRDRINNSAIQESVSPNPYVFLDLPPLQDVAGYDENIFFQFDTVVVQGETVQILVKPLDHYKDVIYRFGQSKFDWVEKSLVTESIEQATSTLYLQNSGVVPESMLGAPGINGGLYVANEHPEDNGLFIPQVQGEDYILPQGGVPGSAVLVDRFGSLVTFGAQGVLTQGSTVFTDATVNFNDPDAPILPGYRIKVTSSDAKGSYIVMAVVSDHQLTLHVPAPADPGGKVPWEAYTGYTDAVFDPALVADMSYINFNHLPAEPFKVLLLSPVGTTPATASDQATNRLSANMSGALKSGRAINVRFGLVAGTAANTASMVGLTKTKLGAIANGALTVPDTGSARFASGSFSIQVGTVKFIHNPPPLDPNLLKPVTSFSADPGDAIEYLTVAAFPDPKGRIKFGLSVLSKYDAAQVQYVEEFQPPADLAGLLVEYNPDNGVLNFSQTAMTDFGGTTKAYFVEQMITENRQDVSVSPMLGAFAFMSPVPKDSSVEVSYWQADLEGKKVGPQITEFLPVFVRNEVATRVVSNTYTFNPDLRTIETSIEPIVYIGAVQQNYGKTDFVVEYPPELKGQGRLVFVSQTVPDYVPVNVTYAVREALGGERAYESSTKPVYRPPFFIKAKQHRFGLRTDRTKEFSVGQMLRIGNSCYYIREVKYFPPTPPVAPSTEPGGDITSLGIFPDTVLEVGSRAPGNDTPALITAQPVTTTVDPDGATPVQTTAPAGLMSPIDLTQFPFEPVNRGQSSVVFQGNLTQFASPNHLFEMGGCPFIIASSELSKDGTRTKITLMAPFQTGFSVAEKPTVKLSYRPIYQPASRNFIGVGAAVYSEPVELVLYGETDANGNELPGRTLIPDAEYKLNPYSGEIVLLEPLEQAFGPGQWLILFFTRTRMLAPYVQNGVVVQPRFYADYLHVILPDEKTNGLLGGTLTAQYTFRNPDTFYFRAVSMKQFLGEAVVEAINEITSRQPAGGALRTSTGGTKNWQQGRIGLKAERRYLLDKDRAARNLLDFYNTAIIDFEQIEEAISGGMIGDRDGKFRFWLGRGKDYPTPGYEDEISGDLDTRNIWNEVFNLFNPVLDITIIPEDPVVSPFTVTLVNGELDGDALDTYTFAFMQAMQRPLIKNDIDDLLLTQMAFPQILVKHSFPFFELRIGALYQKTGEENKYSRLFPTNTKSFSMMFPGVGASIPINDPGAYTWGRTIDDKLQSTTFKIIGQLHNPVIGDITNVDNASLHLRRARARIWGYYPDGIPANAFAGSPHITDPCLIAFPTLLRDVPVNPDTGFPDETQLLSQGGGGDIPDAKAGDPVLAVPGFKTGDQLNWGQPDGNVYPAYDSRNFITSRGKTKYAGLFVYDVQYGCVIRFQDKDGNLVTDASRVWVGTAPMAGVQADQFPIVQGDTVYVVPPIGQELVSPPPPPSTLTTDDIIKLATGLDVYRNGFDLLVLADGRIMDLTLPSYDDPTDFGAKEEFGQNPPEPMSMIEGPVEFFYDRLNPLLIPALEGKVQDDTGDYQIPYLKTGVTEMDRFDEAQTGIILPMELVDDLGYEVYPNEYLSNDGAVSTPSVPAPSDFLHSEPATLMTEQDDKPGAPLVPDAQSYDLLFVQVEPTSRFSTSGGPIGGPEGIWQVGAVSLKPIPGGGLGTLVEPPRFVTSTHAPLNALPNRNDTGDPVRYGIGNGLVFTSGPYGGDPQVSLPPGVGIIEDTVAGVTVLDFTSIGSIALNDGATVGVGNLNDIIGSGGDVGNVLRIKLISREDPNINFWPGAYGPPYPWTPPAGLYLMFIELVKVAAAQWTVQIFNNLGVPIGPAIPFGVAPQFGVVYPPGPPPLPAAARMIVIPTLFMPWGPVPPGQENEWFLPYTVAAGPVYQTIYGLEFAMDVQTTAGQSHTAWIDTDRLTFHEVIDMRMSKSRDFQHPISALSLDTQLVVNEVTVCHHPIVNPSVWSTVNAWVNGWVPVNIPIPFTFLPRSGFPVDSAGGTWTDAVLGVSPEAGSLKVMAFEGFNNTPITADDATFSVAASNAKMNSAGALICDGLGICESYYQTPVPPADFERWGDRVAEVAPSNGNLGRIESGDVLIIDRSADNGVVVHPASNKAGSYIIRHAVKDNVMPEANLGTYRATAPGAFVGSGTGWCPLKFPTLLDVAIVGFTIHATISDLAPVRGNAMVSVPGSPLSGFEDPVPLSTSKRLYFILNAPGLTVAFTRPHAVISAQYTAVNNAGAHPIFTLTDFKDANSNVLTQTLFYNLLHGHNYLVSGMKFLPVNVSGSEHGLPDNNCVGVHNDGAIFPAGPLVSYGFRHMTFYPASTVGGAVVVFDSVVGPTIVPGVPGAGQVRTITDGASLEISYQFKPSPLIPIYPWVVHTLDVTQVLHADWCSLNGTIPAGCLVDCLLPTTFLGLGQYVPPLPPPVLPPPPVVFAVGHYAQAGIFIEPSMPRPVLNLDDPDPRVVDATHDLDDPTNPWTTDDRVREIGLRYSGFYYAAPLALAEQVHFQVRRIRRFHDVLTEADQNLLPLRFAYEIRRGRISDYATNNQQRGTVTASGFKMVWNTDHPITSTMPKASDIWNEGTGPYDGTNLGPFDSPDVNINPGDLFRLLDDYGKVIEEVEVAEVISSTEVKLVPPGITKRTVAQLKADGGMRFEIYLRRPPVPHEQSNEQLLELITDKAVTETYADWTAGQGGYVPEMGNGATYPADANKLYDDLNAPGTGGKTFSALGVKTGDIVIVDPAGAIPLIGNLPAVPESGVRPIGDLAVPNRGGPTVYVPGRPNPLDDNRGFYRVTRIVDAGPYLQVNPVSSFSGTPNQPVTFGVTPANNREYTIYPTINDSALCQVPYTVVAPPQEGQMDLRPTRARDPVTQSYVKRTVDPARIGQSIRPFSYKIIRPSKLFSDATIDLVLTIRERMLSWIEFLHRAISGRKSGTYWIFQRDEHVDDLGLFTDPETGLGLLSDGYILSLNGRVDVVPFANTSSCLSFLDRRFWILDLRLNQLTTDLTNPLKMTKFLGPPGPPAFAYTAYTDATSGSGGAVRPVEPDRIEEALNSRDRFRPIRFTWVAYRTHKTLGTMAAIKRYDIELPEREAEQRRLLLLRFSAEALENE